MRPTCESATDSLPGEDDALAVLERRDLAPAEIERIAHDPRLMKSRKLMLAIARHPRTVRHIALPLVRQLFVFELLRLALSPTLATELKLLAEECIMAKIATITVGERLTLAKCGSTRVAASLVSDVDQRVRDAALNNPRMTEMWVVRALMKAGASRALIGAVQRHPKWACRVEVRRALESLLQ